MTRQAIMTDMKGHVVSHTFDLWTMNGRGYLGLTAHWFSLDWQVPTPAYSFGLHRTHCS